MVHPYPKRQLQKVIFLPINKIILTDSNFVGPLWITIEKDKWFYSSLWRKIKHWKSYKNRFQTILDPENENNFQGSIWKAIDKCKQAGYDIILFPETKLELDSEEIKSELHKLLENNIILATIDGHSITDFKNAIEKYNINPHNSYVISQEPELLKKIAEHYYPMHPEYYPEETINLPLGFNLVLWNTTNGKLSSGSNQIEVKSKLPAYLGEITRKEIHIYSSQYIPVLKDKIIFIDNENHEKLNLFISDNYSWLQEQAAQKGCSFIYLPRLLDDPNFVQTISEYLVYNYPYLFAVQEIISKNIGLTPLFWTQTLLELLNLPDFNIPALIRNRASIYDTSPYQFSCITFDITGDFQKQFENYFDNVQPANDTSGVKFKLVEESHTKKENFKDSSASPSVNSYFDEKFDEEAGKLSIEIIQKIERLKENGNYSLLAEIALHIIDNLNLQLPTNNSTQLNLKALTESKLSELQIEWTSKYNFQIVLPDYGNLIVDMPRLPKALYYFFIRHPEGVLLNSLEDYKDEIHSIYSRISNFSEKEKIKENIDRLTDPFDNSLYVNCSRIKNAFVNIMDDNLAKNYYITGAKGSPKKIALPAHYIKILDNY